MRYGYIRNQLQNKVHLIDAMNQIHERNVSIDNMYIEIDASKKNYKKLKRRLKSKDILVIPSIFELSEDTKILYQILQELLEKDIEIYLCDCCLSISKDSSVNRFLDVWFNNIK